MGAPTSGRSSKRPPTPAAPAAAAVLVRHTHPAHERTVLVDWMLGNACNYACSYCPPRLHDGSLSWQKPADVIAFFDRLHAHYVVRHGRRVWLQFTGGEPSMYPGLARVLEAAHARGFLASLISNGSRTRRFWQQFVGFLDAAILTYHHESVDHEAFVEVCATVAARGIPLNVNVTADPDRFDAIVARAEDLRARCPEAWIALKPLRIGFGAELYPYAPDQLERLRRWTARGRGAGATAPRGRMVAVAADGREASLGANDFLLAGTNRWRGWDCAAGLESLRVKGTGEVLRATCGSGGVLGRLGEDFPLPETSQRCDRDRCACLADILITKRRPDA